MSCYRELPLLAGSSCPGWLLALSSFHGAFLCVGWCRYSCCFLVEGRLTRLLNLLISHPPWCIASGHWSSVIVGRWLCGTLLSSVVRSLGYWANLSRICCLHSDLQINIGLNWKFDYYLANFLCCVSELVGSNNLKSVSRLLPIFAKHTFFRKSVPSK